MDRTVVIVVPDLMFQPRIAAVVERLGLRAVATDVPERASAAIAESPALVVVDLHADGIDTDATIRAAKDAGAAVLAFGRHTEPATLRAAREAGADTVVPRSTLVEEMPQIIRSLTATADA
jgi:DNA-binding NarL/FixJ family response regulator